MWRAYVCLCLSHFLSFFLSLCVYACARGVRMQAVILSDKPLGPAGAMDHMEPALLDELLGHIGSLAAVYHKPPSAFGLVLKKNAAAAAAQTAAAAVAATETSTSGARGGNGSSTDVASQTGVAYAMPPFFALIHGASACQPPHWCVCVCAYVCI
jgi:hypothetical protein